MNVNLEETLAQLEALIATKTVLFMDQDAGRVCQVMSAEIKAKTTKPDDKNLYLYVDPESYYSTPSSSSNSEEDNIKRLYKTVDPTVLQYFGRVEAERLLEEEEEDVFKICPPQATDEQFVADCRELIEQRQIWSVTVAASQSDSEQEDSCETEDQVETEDSFGPAMRMKGVVGYDGDKILFFCYR